MIWYTVIMIMICCCYRNCLHFCWSPTTWREVMRITTSLTRVWKVFSVLEVGRILTSTEIR